jgi:hypothetical protein
MVQATFAYDTWCCSDSHELIDAVNTLNEVIETASERAYKKRMAGARKEHEALLEEFNAQREVQQ